jgi:hypothetical protein
VRFSVYEYDTSDEDDDSLNTTVGPSIVTAIQRQSRTRPFSTTPRNAACRIGGHQPAIWLLTVRKVEFCALTLRSRLSSAGHGTTPQRVPGREAQE